VVWLARRQSSHFSFRTATMLKFLSFFAVVASARLTCRNETVSPYFNAVSDYIDSIDDDLWSINKEIYDNPELGYEEADAHELLTSFMESQTGWNVTRSAYGIDTSFIAIFSNGDGPVVSFNAEYGASNRR
jgi:hypothetical protein